MIQPTSTEKKMQDLADGTVGLHEVGLEVGVKQIAGYALNRVIDG